MGAHTNGSIIFYNCSLLLQVVPHLCSEIKALFGRKKIRSAHEWMKWMNSKCSEIRTFSILKFICEIKIWKQESKLSEMNHCIRWCRKTNEILFFGFSGVGFRFWVSWWVSKTRSQCGCARKKKLSDSARVFLLTNLRFRVEICASNFLFRLFDKISLITANNNTTPIWISYDFNFKIFTILHIALSLISRHDYAMEPINKTSTSPTPFDLFSFWIAKKKTWMVSFCQMFMENQNMKRRKYAINGTRTFAADEVTLSMNFFFPLFSWNFLYWNRTNCN